MACIRRLAVLDLTLIDNTPAVAWRRHLPCRGLNDATAVTDMIVDVALTETRCTMFTLSDSCLSRQFVQVLL